MSPSMSPVDECRERRCCVASAVGTVGAAYIEGITRNPSNINLLTAGYLTTLSVLYGKCIELDDEKLVELNDFYKAALSLQDPKTISAVLTGTNQTTIVIEYNKYAIILSSITEQNPVDIFKITSTERLDPNFNFKVNSTNTYKIEFTANSDNDCTLYFSENGRVFLFIYYIYNYILKIYFSILLKKLYNIH